MFVIACGGSRAESTSASATASATTPPAARNVPTCVRSDDKTCVEAETAHLNADLCFGKFSNDGCPRAGLIGVCTRYGQEPLETSVMARTYYYAGTPYGADAAEVQRVCESTNDGRRGKGVWATAAR